MPERFRGELLTMGRYTNPASIFPSSTVLPLLSAVALYPLLTSHSHVLVPSHYDYELLKKTICNINSKKHNQRLVFLSHGLNTNARKRSVRTKSNQNESNFLFGTSYLLFTNDYIEVRIKIKCSFCLAFADGPKLKAMGAIEGGTAL